MRPSGGSLSCSVPDCALAAAATLRVAAALQGRDHACDAQGLASRMDGTCNVMLMAVVDVDRYLGRQGCVIDAHVAGQLAGC